MKEGLFQGITTIVVAQNNEPYAKLYYAEYLSKSYMQQFHKQSIFRVIME